MTPTPDAPNPLPLVITNEEMRLAWIRREATPLSPMLSDYVEYRGHWWINDDTEWIRITEPTITKKLNAQKERSKKLYEHIRLQQRAGRK